MTEIYLTSADGLHARLEQLLLKKLGNYSLTRTDNGKPYVEGNGLFFSLSHSRDMGIIAISDGAVGVDIEVLQNRMRTSVLRVFTERERGEILSEKDFLRHWTVREAYVKTLGGRLAEYLKRLEYFGGELFLDGKPLDYRLDVYDFGWGVGAVCTEVKL